MTRRLFALERYESSGGAPPPVPPGLLTTADTRLVAAVHLTADDMILALVEGPDAETVAAAAAAASWRVDRLTPASWVAPVPVEEEQRATLDDSGDGLAVPGFPDDRRV